MAVELKDPDTLSQDHTDICRSILTALKENGGELRTTEIMDHVYEQHYSDQYKESYFRPLLTELRRHMEGDDIVTEQVESKKPIPEWLWRLDK